MAMAKQLKWPLLRFDLLMNERDRRRFCFDENFEFSIYSPISLLWMSENRWIEAFDKTFLENLRAGDFCEVQIGLEVG